MPKREIEVNENELLWGRLFLAAKVIERAREIELSHVNISLIQAMVRVRPCSRSMVGVQPRDSRALVLADSRRMTSDFSGRRRSLSWTIGRLGLLRIWRMRWVIWPMVTSVPVPRLIS